MGVKYKYKKLLVILRSSKPKKLELTNVQKKAYDTAIRMISDKNSELVMSPVSGKRIIKRRFLNNKNNEFIFITLNKNNLHIVNGVYHYDIYIDDRITEHLAKKFDAKLERKINIMENQIKSSVIESLDNIVDRVNQAK